MEPKVYTDTARTVFWTATAGQSIERVRERAAILRPCVISEVGDWYKIEPQPFPTLETTKVIT